MSVEAVSAALVAEHAAIFGYGVAGAYLNGEARSLARQAEMAHRDRRDAVALWIEAAGGQLVAAAPAYSLPVEVTDGASAMRLAAALEEATAGAWREALGATADDERRFALDAFVDCAVMATRWRRTAGIIPLTLTYPGTT